MLRSISWLILWFHLLLSHAKPLDSTQQKILELDTNIHGLKQSVQQVQQQSSDWSRALATTDKKIAQAILDHQALQQKVEHLTTSLQLNQKELKRLQAELLQHQAKLNQHLQWMLWMGPNQPVRGWMMAQDLPTRDRWLILYAYVVKARHQLIQELREKKSLLMHAQQKKLNDQQEKNHLLMILQKNQIQLEQQKNQQQEIMKHLNATVEAKQQEIMHVEKNKASLESLFKKLIAQKQNQMHDAKKLIDGSSSSKQGSKTSILIQRYHRIEAMKHGLFYVSQEGQPVKAVRSGQVVFSDWLKGYGLLLILDHGQGWMSLYASNQVLYKHRGDRVAAGKIIGAAGHTGGQRLDCVYFEVRKTGQVVSAQRWLVAQKG